MRQTALGPLSPRCATTSCASRQDEPSAEGSRARFSFDLTGGTLVFGVSLTGGVRQGADASDAEARHRALISGRDRDGAQASMRGK